MDMRCFFLVLLSAWTLHGTVRNVVTLHVSPSGDDAHAGTAVQPLRTFDGARRAVRGVKGDVDVEVVFHDGVYPMAAPVAFDEEDSPAAGRRIVYRASTRGGAVFDGGVRLGWKPLAADDPAAALIPAAVRDRVKAATIPAGQELPDLTGGRCFPNKGPAWFYVNGRAVPIAAWPDASDDWSNLYREFAEAEYTKDLQELNAGDKARMRFICREREKLSRWTREPDLWVYGCWKYEWDDTTAQILSADPATGVVELDKRQITTGYDIGHEGSRYRVINALSEMDRPGEWAIDRKNRRAYRYDDGTEPVMSSAISLVCARKLGGVVFDGLVFRHARKEALRFEDCRDVRVRGCTISACGGSGVIVSGGRDCRVEGCDVHHVGESGITLGGGERKTLTRCGHAAVNNHVHHWGERLPLYRPAIGFGRAGNTGGAYCCGGLIEHNLIHHGRHEAIYFIGHLNDIRWNMIHDVCACSRDCGAIYGYNESDWSLSRGTRIEHNCIYMTGYPGAGRMFYVIYVDGFVSGVTARENICIGGDIGLFSQGGQANVYERNLVCLCMTAAHRSNLASWHPACAPNGPLWKALQRDKAMFQAEPWASAFPELVAQSKMADAVLGQSAMYTVFRDNVFAASGYPNWQDEAKVGKYNVVTNNLRVAGDPGFVDYFHYDWNLRPDSEAYRLVGDLGFERMGLTNGPDRASAAVRFGADPTPPPVLKIPMRPASTRIDLQYAGPETFSDDRPIAKDMLNCSLPAWNQKKNDRIVGNDWKVDRNWKEYKIAFTPTIDGEITVELMGAIGYKTCVDDVRVEGSELVNGGFEGEGGWSKPVVSDYGGRSDLSKPYGIVACAEPNCAPEGRRCAVVSHDIRLQQRIRLEAGRRLVIRWRAAAWR